MIIFLNFAPFNFAGGAERWMVDVSDALNKTERVTLIDVDSSIANIYGNLVLKQSFNQRLKIDSKSDHLSLKLTSFIPFTRQWTRTKKLINNSRLIYIRYELLESLIVLYFGGIAALKKTIAGAHTPIFYQKPVTIFDNAHNFVYGSMLSKWLLSKMSKVHVVNSQDKNYITAKFNLKNVIEIPNYIKMSDIKYVSHENRTGNSLNIAFIGELNKRKGADILLDTIKLSPDNFVFHIAGDGPYKNEIENLNGIKNIKYYGYLTRAKLSNLYNSCDVLFAPSRAEAFSLVSLESMSYGLPVISSSETDLNLPSFVQYVNRDGSIEEYVKMFTEILKAKRNGYLKNQKSKVREFVKKTFSHSAILPQLQKQLFNN